MDWRKRRHRRRSINEPGHAHELTFSCYRRYEFLKAERTCIWLAKALDEARHEHDYLLWAYVFMPEHVHLVVCPRERIYKVSNFLQAVKAPVDKEAIAYLRVESPEWIPRLTRRRGSRIERLFWQSGGGYDRNIDEPRTLQAMIDYTHLNPVRRKLVERADDWKWSSASWYCSGAAPILVPDPIPPEWLCS